MSIKEAHEKGLEAAVYKYDRTYSIVDDYEAAVAAIIKAYLNASGMVLVPKHMTSEMVKNVQMYSEMGAYVTSEWAGAYDVMDEYWAKLLECTPKPFQTPEESREKK